MFQILIRVPAHTTSWWKNKEKKIDQNFWHSLQNQENEFSGWEAKAVSMLASNQWARALLMWIGYKKRGLKDAK